MYEFDPERLQKLEALRSEGFEPFPAALPVTHTAVECLALGRDRTAAELEANPVECVVAGRILAKNEMGKAGFAMLQDRSGRVQVYVKHDDVGSELFSLWKRLDLGDVLRVEGYLMLTRRGDLTLRARSIRLTSKCMKSLPDKWKGLTDCEFRHRHRYVDLFMNPEVRNTFQVRSRVVALARRFFMDRDFLEVETPMMQVIPGGATARPFITHHNALDMDLYLRVAPELYLKRLVVGGFERVFELNRNFRNEGLSLRHNPEFTMLEFYQAHATYEDLILLTEELFAGLVEQIHGGSRLSWAGRDIDLSRPWRRASMGQLIAEATGIDPACITDVSVLRARWIEDHPIKALPSTAGAEDPRACADEKALPQTWGKWWEWFFEAYVEKNLVNPTFVTRHPVEISPLSRRSADDPRFVDRFELFVGGQEMANAFTELNDPVDQAGRFAAQAAAREAGEDEAMFFDADYIEALSYGMPPAAGEGIGIDRLVMLLTDQSNIREVILFPTLRPRKAASSMEEANVDEGSPGDPTKAPEAS